MASQAGPVRKKPKRGAAARPPILLGRLAMLAAVMFALGFAGARYWIGPGTPPPAPISRRLNPPPPSPSPAAAATAEPPAIAAPEWLKRLNYYRTMAKLAPVAEDLALSWGDDAHAQYLVKNYRGAIAADAAGAEMHTEELGNEWFTTAGLAAAKASDIVQWTVPANAKGGKRRVRDRSGLVTDSGWGTPQWSIDGWMAIPFHRIPMLDPRLVRAGFGTYCEAGVCAAALNVQDGIGARTPQGGAAPWPIEFPPDDSVIGLRSFGNEWPDPRVNCPGYGPPSGIAITLMLGEASGARLSDFQIRSERAGTSWSNVEACGFDFADYTNPDAQAEQNAREGLRNYGAMVVIPRAPLEPGTKYYISIEAGGRSYQWSFSTAE